MVGPRVLAVGHSDQPRAKCRDSHRCNHRSPVQCLTANAKAPRNGTLRCKDALPLTDQLRQLVRWPADNERKRNRRSAELYGMYTQVSKSKRATRLERVSHVARFSSVQKSPPSMLILGARGPFDKVPSASQAPGTCQPAQSPTASRSGRPR